MLPETGRRKTAKIVGSVLVASLVLVATVAYWDLAIRPLTMQEVLERDHWRAGEVRDLEGTIVDVARMNTSLGPVVILELEMPEDLGTACGAYGDPNATYRIGDRFRTTLHFGQFTYNGRPAVWAPELSCPFPLLSVSIGVVMDAVALVAGIGLEFASADADGWTTYRVITMNGDRFPSDRVPAYIRRGPPSEDLLPAGQALTSAAAWILVATAEYVALTGGYRPEWEIDNMTSLGLGTSQGGHIRFLDVDADGMIGDFDRIAVRLDRRPGTYQSYFLQIGRGMGNGPSALTAGMKAILQTPDGPLHWIPEDRPGAQLTYAGDVIGMTVLSRIDVGRTVGRVRRLEEYEFQLVIDDGIPLRRVVTDAPVLLPGGISVDFWEPATNGLLESGDRFYVDGLRSGSAAGLTLFHQQNLISSIGWRAGFGRVAGILPDVEFWTGSGTPYTFGANVSHWHSEFELGRTLAVSLAENSTLMLDHVPLMPGVLGAWPGGSLSFTDVDSDGAWSSADEFTLQANSGARYHVEVSLLFDSRKFSLDLGP